MRMGLFQLSRCVANRGVLSDVSRDVAGSSGDSRKRNVAWRSSSEDVENNRDITQVSRSKGNGTAIELQVVVREQRERSIFGALWIPARGKTGPVGRAPVGSPGASLASGVPAAR